MAASPLAGPLWPEFTENQEPEGERDPSGSRVIQYMKSIGSSHNNSKNSSTPNRACFKMWDKVDRFTGRCAGKEQ